VVVKTNLVPTVSITSPANNASFASGSTIPISVFATDKDGQIVKVMFFNGSTKLGEDLSSPHNFNWTNVPAGTYQLTARTIDNVGAIGISPAITVVVKAATNARISSESDESAEVNESDLTLDTKSYERARIFSQNSDGINDTWIWHTKKQHCICSIVIYDRAGRAVFQNDGLQNNWDGTFNGNSLPEAIYYYETNIEGVKKTGVVRIVK
jgi:gliding motility-associated-like protein